MPCFSKFSSSGRIQRSGHAQPERDYMSDALAAEVGGLGMAPGGNIGDGLAVSKPPMERRRNTPAGIWSILAR